MELAAPEPDQKISVPPLAPLCTPALLIISAVSAFELLKKSASPPPAPLTTPPLLIIVALPALAPAENWTRAGTPPLMVGPSVMNVVNLPAVPPNSNPNDPEVPEPSVVA